MASDYEAIRSDNIKRYGTDIGLIGPMLLSDRYDDRTHFIYELLQNAEDALGRHQDFDGPRSVEFSLSTDSLRVSHNGKPFTEPDVRGICGIGRSTKSEKFTEIGRFGIGFKSVYAFTDAPEIYSGNEHFAIDSFVWPREISPLDTQQGETIFVIPFRRDDPSAFEEIASGLRKLGVRTLLFLREIEGISWAVVGGPSGLYLRSKPETLSENARRIVLIGQEGEKEVDETWLLFSREVRTGEGTHAGYVEVAFAIDKDTNDSYTVRRVNNSSLMVFFPTIVSANLGFLIQGPYRTTPSRDNVPKHDEWNRYLVTETSSLLVEALRMLRNMGLLSIEALRALPLERTKFGEGSMFAPLFEAVRSALATEALLPRFDNGHIPGNRAKLARTQDLRDLFSPSQLGLLFGIDGEHAWLRGDISPDRTPELRQYLMRELEITEITPESILLKLDKLFLEVQPDEWIQKLYEFLYGQPALLRSGRVYDIPLIRLEDGSHVMARNNGHPEAFLPGPVSTGFPTVRWKVCQAENARAFLRSMGLTEPDPVDDVVWNVLPKYTDKKMDITDADYESDIGRILTAFKTDSKAQRDKLLSALREASVVMAVDTGTRSSGLSKPGEVYLATQRLKDLFEGVSDVLLVDDSYPCLRGEDVRELLEACGATRYLQPIPAGSNFTWEEKRAMRHKGGCESYTYEIGIDDFTLRGLQQLLDNLSSLYLEKAKIKAGFLWESLCDVEDRRGTGAFSGTYRWQYYHSRSFDFDAAFVRQLNAAFWVPNSNGNLQPPEFVVFETLGWKSNPFLLSIIRFKPPIIETLAREAGIEPALIDLLKKLNLTSEAELRTRLGITEEPPQQEEKPDAPSSSDAIKQLIGNSPDPTPPVPDPSGPGYTGSGVVSAKGANTGLAGIGHTRTPGSVGGRPFISYVGTSSEEEEVDPDGLSQKERMDLEEKAITLIIQKESQLRRTHVNNAGFDLVECDTNNQAMRWIEVKAMTGTLLDRPVCMSHTQFECAQQHGEAYWLYVVEQANSGNARILRIKNPAGNASSFTFDHGWAGIAEHI